jgi:hypothetical protein
MTRKSSFSIRYVYRHKIGKTFLCWAIASISVTILVNRDFRKRSISNVISAIKSCLRDPVFQSIACKFTRRRSTRSPALFQDVIQSMLRFMEWKVIFVIFVQLYC